jgi:hypothetical protein
VKAPVAVAGAAPAGGKWEVVSKGDPVGSAAAAAAAAAAVFLVLVLNMRQVLYWNHDSVPTSNDAVAKLARCPCLLCCIQ